MGTRGLSEKQTQNNHHVFYEPKFACRHTQIYAHAGTHKHRSNTEGTDALMVMCRMFEPTEGQGEN